jgi:hypothetical protein
MVTSPGPCGANAAETALLLTKSCLLEVSPRLVSSKN